MGRLEEIQDRWDEIENELAAISEGKVIDGDPAKREKDLLQEQDRLEYAGGLLVFCIICIKWSRGSTPRIE